MLYEDLKSTKSEQTVSTVNALITALCKPRLLLLLFFFLAGIVAFLKVLLFVFLSFSGNLFSYVESSNFVYLYYTKHIFFKVLLINYGFRISVILHQ